MMVLEDLISTYHSLGGTTIAEKKKNLNNFMDIIESSVTSEDLNKLILLLVPKNYLEEIFKVDILIHFKRNSELLEVLQSGNPVLIGKVLNYWKFFEETFKDIEETILIDSIFPNVSFSTRMKILTRLSTNLKNEKQADVYFNAIERKYGLKIACAMLPGCTLELIKQIVSTYNFKLSNKHLFNIVRKYKEFLAFYFEIIHKRNNKFDFSNEYRNVLRYIAKIDTELFWDLFKKYDLNLKFGRHMTPKVLQVNKEILKNKDKLQLFDSRMVFYFIKRNKQDLKEFFLNLYPETIDDFETKFSCNEDLLYKFLNYIPKNKRYEVLSNNFKEKYTENLHEFPECLSADTLEIMPENLCELVLNKKVIEVESLIYLYNTSKSIPLIKDRIKHTSDINKRKLLIQQLLHTCQFRNDGETLLDVLKYLLLRHKNDFPSLISFMSKLSQWPNLEKLSHDHWTRINDLLKLLVIGKKRFYSEKVFMEKYFIFLLENKLPFENHLKTFFKYLKEEHFQICPFSESSKYKKMCLEHFGVLMPTIYEGKDYDGSCIFFLSAIANYNQSNPKDQIPITNYPEMINIVKNQLDGDFDYLAVRILQYCVKIMNDDFDSFYWENYKQLHNDNLLFWYIQRFPQKVSENIVEVVTHSEYQNDRLLKLLRKFSHLRIPEKVIEFALDTLHNDNYKYGNFAVKALAYLASEQQFFDVIKTFYPCDDGIIDLKEPPEKLTLQLEIIGSMKYIKNSPTLLPVILKFCVGDFLNHAVPPLYHITANLPEKYLTEFYNVLCKPAVSVQKHAIALTCITCTKQIIYNLLKQTGLNEKHTSIQNVIFKWSLKYFVDNPNEEFWNLLLSHINIIDKDDREAHDTLINIKNMPLEYMSKYIPLVYKKLSSSSDKAIREKKYGLLASIPINVIDTLQKDFLKEVMADTLFQQKSNQWPEELFSFKCIFHTCIEKQTDLLDFMFEVVKGYIQKNWTDLFTFDASRQNIYQFVLRFCTEAINLNERILMDQFVKNWKTVFKPEDVIEEYLLLELTVVYFSCNSDCKMNEFGSKSNEILLSIIKKYDASIIDYFTTQTNSILKICSTHQAIDINFFNFIDNFCKASESQYGYIAVLKMLNLRAVTEKDLKNKYLPIFKTFQKCDDVIFQVHFKQYLKNL